MFLSNRQAKFGKRPFPNPYTVTVFIAFLSSLSTITRAYGQAIPDSLSQSERPLLTSFSGRVRIANIGFAPLPAYSFDQPIGIVVLKVSKRKLIYEPAFAIGLNGKPWMIDNWLRYRFIDKRRINVSVALNPSLFFKTENVDPDKEPLIAQRNLCFDISAAYLTTRQTSVSVSWQYVNGIEDDTPAGQILFARIAISRLQILKNLLVDINPQLFCFDFTGKNDGVFCSIDLNISRCTFPLDIFLQGVQRIWSNFEGKVLRWSFGLVYHFAKNND